MMRRSPRTTKPRALSLDKDRQRLHDEEEKIRLLEEKIRKQEEAARRKLENLPKELEERQRRQQELMRLHLVSAPTRADGLSKLRDKRHPQQQKLKVAVSKRIAEQRAARMQFILLCIVLGVVLLLLWKSLPS